MRLPVIAGLLLLPLRWCRLIPCHLVAGPRMLCSFMLCPLMLYPAVLYPSVLGQTRRLSGGAEPPHWTPDERAIFFDDARQHLVGDRPQPVNRGGVDPLAAQSPRILQNGNLQQGPPESVSAARRWSELIEGATLTAEIKRINNQLATALKTSVSYQGGGNVLCQRDFGLLAVLFGVVAEYDEAKFGQNSRWQRSARFMQSICFQTGQQCAEASVPSFAAAKQTHAMLGELIRGQVPASGGAVVSKESHFSVALTPLMQSLELLLKQRISPAIASPREFRKRYRLTSEQGQLVAALAEALQQPGSDYADDDTYLDEARQLRLAASELARAAREKNYEAARAAAGRVSQSCSRCHEDFRG